MGLVAKDLSSALELQLTIISYQIIPNDDITLVISLFQWGRSGVWWNKGTHISCKTKLDSMHKIKEIDKILSVDICVVNLSYAFLHWNNRKIWNISRKDIVLIGRLFIYA